MEFSFDEIAAIVDALNKGASRHESYAKFYANRKTDSHVAMAKLMKQLKARVQLYARNKYRVCTGL